MENTPKISIIVPVYNAEKEITRCVESILGQSYTNFELLLVDDGSKDSSLSLCRSFAEKDNRINVFHKKNGGANSARAFGVREAGGEYINFVDADDYIPSTSLSTLVSIATTDQLDIVQCARKFLPIGGEKETFSFFPQTGVFDSEQFISFLFAAKCNGGPVGSLYCRELFGEETFHLDNDVVLGEDFYMNLCLGIKAKKIGLNNSLVYVYIENEYSATHNYEFVSVLPLKHQLEGVRRILEENHLFQKFSHAYYANAIFTLSSACFHNSDLLQSDFVKQVGREGAKYAIGIKEKMLCKMLQYPILFPMFNAANKIRQQLMS